MNQQIDTTYVFPKIPLNLFKFIDYTILKLHVCVFNIGSYCTYIRPISHFSYTLVTTTKTSLAVVQEY